MKKLFTVALLFSAVAWGSGQTYILWSSQGFENYNSGDFVGQYDVNNHEIDIMSSDSDSSSGVAPYSGEQIITTDPNDDNNKVLLVKRKKQDSEVGKKDRGSRLYLNWDSKFQRDKGDLKIKGRFYSTDDGYAEIRLANPNGARMLRFSPDSYDYKSYFHHTGNGSLWNNAVVQNYVNNVSNKWTIPCANLSKFSLAGNGGSYRLVMPRPTLNRWWNFEIVVSLASNCLVYYKISDGSGNDTIYDNHVNVLQYGAYLPQYLDFTCAGNGYDLNRGGAYFDDLEVTYELDEPLIQTVIDDDMTTYSNDKLLPQNPFYKVINTKNYALPYSQAYITNCYGSQCCFFTPWNYGQNGYPKQALVVPLPDGFAGLPGAVARITSVVWAPDNGTWGAAFFTDAQDLTEAACLGYHANYKYFLTIGNGTAASGSSANSPQLYDLATPNYGTARWMRYIMEIENDETGLNAIVKYAKVRNDSLDYQSYGINFATVCEDITIPSPSYAGVMEQSFGWDKDPSNPDNHIPNRYLLLKELKVEVVLPEPGLLALLGLLLFGLVRKTR